MHRRILNDQYNLLNKLAMDRNVEMPHLRQLFSTRFEKPESKINHKLNLIHLKLVFTFMNYLFLLSEDEVLFIVALVVVVVVIVDVVIVVVSVVLSSILSVENDVVEIILVVFAVITD
jgi:hypothetical protein